MVIGVLIYLAVVLVFYTYLLTTARQEAKN
jgi:hypothetical protein